MKPNHLCAFVIAAASALPAAAAAQGRSALEEIIVTAQKREEAIQDVPVAISAFGAESLERMGVSNLLDLQGGKIPSLQVAPFAGRPGQLLIAVRGIAPSDPAQLTAEQPNALYLDGVYLARAVGLDTELFELERMEVLRGPQGTLFGRNSMGGAINLITQKPQGTFGFKQLLEASDLDVYRAKTVIDTPEVAGWAARFEYLYSYAAGWIDNPLPGQKEFNWYDKDGYRIALAYEPSDNLRMDYSYDFTEMDYTQNLPVLVSKPTTLVPGTPALLTPTFDSRQERAWIGAQVPTASSEAKGHNLTLTWDVHDSLTFKSISSYREMTDDNYSPQMGTAAFVPAGTFGARQPNPLSGSTSTAHTVQDQWSQEFQLIGESNRLEWQLGALYFHEDGTFTANSLFNIAYVGGTGPFRNIGATPVGIDPFWTNSITRTSVDTDSLGIYGQATWTPPIFEDRLHLTLGLRYSRDEKDVHRNLQSSQVVDIGAQPTTERVDPALTIAYDLTNSASVYLRYSTAYRGGGVSVREVGRFSPYGEEKLQNVELGLKSEFWNRRARINAAVFYNEIDDLQATFQQTTGCPGACNQANTIFANLDRPARLSGLELDASVLLFEGLTVSFAYTHLDDDMPLVINPETPAAQRERIFRPQAPSHAWSLNVDYEFAPSRFGVLAAHVDVADTSAYCLTVRGCIDGTISTGPIAGIEGGKNNRLVNARLTLSEIPLAGAGTLQAALWGKNLTDEEWVNFGFTAPGALTNTSVVQYGEPRSVGVTLTYKY